MSDKHTELPWHAVAGPPEYVRLLSANGDEIARLYREGTTINGAWQAEIDATFIVQSANSYYQMREALQAALKDAECRLYMLPVNGDAVQENILSAQIGRYKAALAAAERET